MIAVTATALLGGAALWAQRPGGTGQVPEQVQACVALGDAEAVRACLAKLRANSDIQPPRRQGQGDALLRFLIAEYLDLTEEQKAAAAGLRQSMQESMAPLRQQIAENFRQIRQAAKDGTPVDVLADEQGRLFAEVIKTTAAKRAEARTALNLTIEQEARLEALIERMGPGARGGEGRDPGFGGFGLGPLGE
ncbi:MAG: hypothetical protein IPM24_15010 [Bryobacterales bacterium]|nr:hypothetical protein [Bryobacterales bacterium]